MNRRQLLMSLAAAATLPKLALASGGFKPTRADAVHLPDAEWRKRLSPESYKVLRQAGTERAFTGKLWNHKGDGVYACAGCALPLFDSRTKYESGTGWPSFWAPIGRGFVGTAEDRSWFSVRVEVLCNRCGGHLGHVFNDGPAPTGKRYCMNSAALHFMPWDHAVERGELPQGYKRPTKRS